MTQAALPLAEDDGKPPSCWQRALRIARLILAVLLHGIGTGVIGIWIAILIRQVQEFGFGDGHGGFLEIAVQAPPWRRTASVTAGGVFGAVAWYWLRGQRTFIVSVEESLTGAKMPPVITILNGMVQDIVVALGGSFGREAAPREIAAMWGGQLSDALGVSQEERRVLVACGTGAGLAAVYSVPISGALYTLEHVLNWNLSFVTVLPAVATSCIATLVAGIVVEDEGLYAMPKYSYEWPSLVMLLWAAMIGPLAGLAAISFRRLVKVFEGFKPLARQHVFFTDMKEGDYVWLAHQQNGYEVRQGAKVLAKTSERVSVSFDDGVSRDFDEADFDAKHPEGPRDWTILVAMPVAFLALGLLSICCPSLLGNGRALAEVAINRERTLAFFVMLIFFKATMTASAIGSGAAGGTLTPSVALGATLGTVIGESWQFVCPHLAPKDDAPMSIVAAAAFLAIMLRSPVSSVALMIEFAAQGIREKDLLALLHGDPSGVLRSKGMAGMLLPMSIAVLGALAASRVVNKLYDVMQQRLESKLVMPEPGSADKLPMLAGDDAVLAAAKVAKMRQLARRRMATYDLDLADKREEQNEAATKGYKYQPLSTVRNDAVDAPEKDAGKA